MLPEPDAMDLAELSERADVSVRTIRYYIQQGLLPSPDARGPGARYGAEHLDRLRVIRRMQREHLPLAEIRRRIEALGPGEVRRLAAETPEKPRSSAREYIRGALSEPPGRFDASMAQPMVAMSAPSPMRAAMEPMAAPALATPPPARSQWDRIALAPDVELHVRRPLSREQNRQVERLMQAARDIFEEDAR